MKRELIITIIIVVIIIIAGILTQENTKKVMSDINGKLEDLKQSVLTDTENEELSKNVDKIYDDWLEKDKFLSSSFNNITSFILPISIHRYFTRPN